jgi:signal transduction histidine kinase
VLLLARQATRLSSRPSPFLSLLPLLDEPAVCESALRGLDEDHAVFIDWDQPEVQPVYRAALAYARQAHWLAHRTGQCDPETAWACGLLAPLGWLAACALDAVAVTACLNDPKLADDPAAVQRRLWGPDQGSIARRLARHWQLPPWLAAITGDLNLPLPVAVLRGAEPILFCLTRLAIRSTPEPGLFLAALAAPHAEEDCRNLNLPPTALEGGPTASADSCAEGPWHDPRTVPLLRDLLRIAAENRQLRQQPLHAGLEQEVDDLHHALDERIRTEAQRLQEGRLQALAEFAAGAGHEINNPLAVISGQAQYLLGHAAEWCDTEAQEPTTRALEAIIAQTRRIHGLLRDVMLFARPTPPCHGWFDLPTLLGEVAGSQGDLAAMRKVRIEIIVEPERFAVEADAGQVRLALQCLLRNAIEAAPADGWARLVLHDDGQGAVVVAVEDNGPGPAPGQQELLFDLFYSGRSAGRGRGLGLPTAWRLARQQGGNVRLCSPCAGEPTRFELTLPRPTEPPPPALFPTPRPQPSAPTRIAG